MVTIAPVSKGKTTPCPSFSPFRESQRSRLDPHRTLRSQTSRRIKREAGIALRFILKYHRATNSRDTADLNIDAAVMNGKMQPNSLARLQKAPLACVHEVSGAGRWVIALSAVRAS